MGKIIPFPEPNYSTSRSYISYLHRTIMALGRGILLLSKSSPDNKDDIGKLSNMFFEVSDYHTKENKKHISRFYNVTLDD